MKTQPNVGFHRVLKASLPCLNTKYMLPPRFNMETRPSHTFTMHESLRFSFHGKKNAETSKLLIMAWFQYIP